MGRQLRPDVVAMDVRMPRRWDDRLAGAFYGVNFGQIAAVAFGATSFAGEFRDGVLRISLTAVPDRSRLYLCKAAEVAVLAFVVGEVTGVVAFVTGRAFMGGAGAGRG
ncbi:hypothetical protein [Streptomyces sp. NPDC054838]